MTKTTAATLLTTLFSAAASTVPTEAGHAHRVHRLSSELHCQIRTVERLTLAAIPRRCDAAEILDELDDLCRLVDRFEEQLRDPYFTRGTQKRLERYARKISRQACEVQEEVHEALDRLRRRGPGPHPLAHRGATPPGYTSFRKAALSHRSFAYTASYRGVSFSFGSPRVARHAPRVGYVSSPGPSRGAARALCAQADRLHDLAEQLELMFCH